VRHVHICRALFIGTSVLIGGCSEAQAPPPPQPPPPTPAYREQYADAYPTDFPSRFTIVFSREYGMWTYKACTLTVDLSSNDNRAEVFCYPAERAPVTARRNLTVDEAARLRRLAERADLYRADHIGVDISPTDGNFDTIRVRPILGGRAVVLVTSGNRSFADDEARRDMLGLLKGLLLELVAAAV